MVRNQMGDNILKATDETIDHYTGQPITRPENNPTLLYDFDFRRSSKEPWRYLNSSNSIKKMSKQIQAILEKEGSEYRIILSSTAEIIRTNAKEPTTDD